MSFDGDLASYRPPTQFEA